MSRGILLPCQASASLQGSSYHSTRSPNHLPTPRRPQVRQSGMYRGGQTSVGRQMQQSRPWMNVTSTMTMTMMRRQPMRSQSVSPQPMRSRQSVSVMAAATNDQQLETSSVESEDELESVKVADLKAMAKAEGLRGYSKLKKAEVIAMLRAHRVGGSQDEAV
eukprot:CAMPEP_0197851204 /NCGR_PEP_ID=MMETSP1438-20131217/17524_1 /TAXON_ID=1461541 /ORGANISM="Pterosperma sp., Strain CCMP1384" /LENGTH=161 /DNA_ID=CAMNT_0043464727 /DNA_START=26 /DNA_END=508 /DNA_ORIENTATION=-